MTQSDILKTLKKAKKGLTPKEIAKKLDQSSSSINANLRKLRQKNEVISKEIKNIPEIEGHLGYVYWGKG